MSKTDRREARRKATEELVDLENLRQEMEQRSADVSAAIGMKDKAMVMASRGKHGEALGHFQESIQAVNRLVTRLPRSLDTAGDNGANERVASKDEEAKASR